MSWLAVVLALAAGVARADAIVPSRVTPEPEGRFRLEGQVTKDACGGAVMLAARTIEVTPEQLHADVVDRIYRRTARRGVYEVAGNFVEKGNRIDERWTLERVDDDHLTGTLVSGWRFGYDLNAFRCEITFRLRATRIFERRGR